MEFPIDIDQEITSFFAPPPKTGAGEGNVRAILFLLRRDLRDLTIPENEIPNTHTRIRAPILASVGLMIGFELLARIWLGDNDPTQLQITTAFKDILSINSHTADLMVKFRNALAHGYQLEIHARNDEKYRFALGDNVGVGLWFEKRERSGESEYHVNFWELRKRFLDSVKKVQNHLQDPRQLQLRKKFHTLLPCLKPYHMVSGVTPTKSVL